MGKIKFSCSNPECDKEFERYESTVRNKLRVYCSPECRAVHLKTLLKGENNPNWKGVGDTNVKNKLAKALFGEETLKEIREAATKYFTFSEIAREVGAPRTTVIRMMTANNISKLPPPPVFEVAKTKRNSVVRKAVLDNDLIPYVCSECSQGPKWNGKPLVLQLDHINGDAYNNRLENLRFLCPNCHTQTDTYCGRNKRNG